MTSGIPGAGDVDALRAALDGAGYLADDALATALFLAVAMGQPILLEGEPGVGKTQAAKALAQVLDTPLLRLQCYEGLTASEALYEWNYPRQLLAIRLAESRGEQLRDADLFKRPGVAETIDWAGALQYLDQQELSAEAVDETLGVLLKYQDDISKVRGAEAGRLIAEAKAKTQPPL